MVDMFFYRDPEEVERQQQEEAQAKSQALGAVVEPQENLGPTVWDPTSAPQAGGINPGLVSQDGGAIDWSADTGAGGPTDWSAEQAPGSTWAGDQPTGNWAGGEQPAATNWAGGDQGGGGWGDTQDSTW